MFYATHFYHTLKKGIVDIITFGVVEQYHCKFLMWVETISYIFQWDKIEFPVKGNYLISINEDDAPSLFTVFIFIAFSIQLYTVLKTFAFST